MRVLIVEDEPDLAEAGRDGCRLEAIAADITGSAVRNRPGEPWLTATVPGVGYRIDTGTAPRPPWQHP